MSKPISQEILENVMLKHPYSLNLLRNAQGILERDELRSTPHGWVVKSMTKERTEYCISMDGEKCGCLAGQHELLCSHRLALYLRLELFRQAQTDAIALRAMRMDVISQREDMARQNKVALGEWEEELV